MRCGVKPCRVADFCRVPCVLINGPAFIRIKRMDCSVLHTNPRKGQGYMADVLALSLFPMIVSVRCVWRQSDPPSVMTCLLHVLPLHQQVPCKGRRNS